MRATRPRYWDDRSIQADRPHASAATRLITGERRHPITRRLSSPVTALPAMAIRAGSTRASITRQRVLHSQALTSPSPAADATLTRYSMGRAWSVLHATRLTTTGARIHHMADSRRRAQAVTPSRD